MEKPQKPAGYKEEYAQTYESPGASTVDQLPAANPPESNVNITPAQSPAPTAANSPTDMLTSGNTPLPGVVAGTDESDNARLRSYAVDAFIKGSGSVVTAFTKGIFDFLSPTTVDDEAKNRIREIADAMANETDPKILEMLQRQALIEDAGISKSIGESLAKYGYKLGKGMTIDIIPMITEAASEVTRYSANSIKNGAGVISPEEFTKAHDQFYNNLGSTIMGLAIMKHGLTKANSSMKLLGDPTKGYLIDTTSGIQKVYKALKETKDKIALQINDHINVAEAAEKARLVEGVPPVLNFEGKEVKIKSENFSFAEKLKGTMALVDKTTSKLMDPEARKNFANSIVDEIKITAESLNKKFKETAIPEFEKMSTKANGFIKSYTEKISKTDSLKPGHIEQIIKYGKELVANIDEVKTKFMKENDVKINEIKKFVGGKRTELLGQLSKINTKMNHANDLAKERGTDLSNEALSAIPDDVAVTAEVQPVAKPASKDLNSMSIEEKKQLYGTLQEEIKATTKDKHDAMKSGDTARAKAARKAIADGLKLAKKIKEDIISVGKKGIDAAKPIVESAEKKVLAGIPAAAHVAGQVAGKVVSKTREAYRNLRDKFTKTKTKEADSHVVELNKIKEQPSHTQADIDKAVVTEKRIDTLDNHSKAMDKAAEVAADRTEKHETLAEKRNRKTEEMKSKKFFDVEGGDSNPNAADIRYKKLNETIIDYFYLDKKNENIEQHKEYMSEVQKMLLESPEELFPGEYRMRADTQGMSLPLDEMIQEKYNIVTDFNATSPSYFRKLMRKDRNVEGRTDYDNAKNPDIGDHLERAMASISEKGSAKDILFKTAYSSDLFGASHTRESRFAKNLTPEQLDGAEVGISMPEALPTDIVARLEKLAVLFKEQGWVKNQIRYKGEMFQIDSMLPKDHVIEHPQLSEARRNKVTVDIVDSKGEIKTIPLEEVVSKDAIKEIGDKVSTIDGIEGTIENINYERKAPFKRPPGSGYRHKVGDEVILKNGQYARIVEETVINDYMKDMHADLVDSAPGIKELSAAAEARPSLKYVVEDLFSGERSVVAYNFFEKSVQRFTEFKDWQAHAENKFKLKTLDKEAAAKIRPVEKPVDESAKWGNYDVKLIDVKMDPEIMAPMATIQFDAGGKRVVPLSELERTLEPGEIIKFGKGKYAVQHVLDGIVTAKNADNGVEVKIPIDYVYKTGYIDKKNYAGKIKTAEPSKEFKKAPTRDENIFRDKMSGMGKSSPVEKKRSNAKFTFEGDNVGAARNKNANIKESGNEYSDFDSLNESYVKNKMDPEVYLSAIKDSNFKKFTDDVMPKDTESLIDKTGRVVTNFHEFVDSSREIKETFDLVDSATSTKLKMFNQKIEYFKKALTESEIEKVITDYEAGKYESVKSLSEVPDKYKQLAKWLYEENDKSFKLMESAQFKKNHFPHILHEKYQKGAYVQALPDTIEAANSITRNLSTDITGSQFEKGQTSKYPYHKTLEAFAIYKSAVMENATKNIKIKFINELESNFINNKTAAEQKLNAKKLEYADLVKKMDTLEKLTPEEINTAQKLADELFNPKYNTKYWDNMINDTQNFKAYIKREAIAGDKILMDVLNKKEGVLSALVKITSKLNTGKFKFRNPEIIKDGNKTFIKAKVLDPISGEWLPKIFTVQDMIGGNKPYSGMLNQARTMQYGGLLGLNISAAISQINNLWTTISILPADIKSVQSFAKALVNSFSKDPLRDIERSKVGVFEGGEMFELLDQYTKDSEKSLFNRALKFVMTPLAFMDKYARTLTFETLYERAMKDGATPEAARMSAAQVTKSVNFSFSDFSTEKLYQSAEAKVLFTYTQNTLKTAKLFWKMATDSTGHPAVANYLKHIKTKGDPASWFNQANNRQKVMVAKWFLYTTAAVTAMSLVTGQKQQQMDPRGVLSWGPYRSALIFHPWTAANKTVQGDVAGAADTMAKISVPGYTGVKDMYKTMTGGSKNGER